MEDKNKTVVQTPILGLLFLILVWLKLNPGGNFTTPVADWSWWWITLPLWGPLLLGAIIVLFIVILTAITGKKIL